MFFHLIFLYATGLASLRSYRRLVRAFECGWRPPRSPSRPPCFGNSPSQTLGYTSRTSPARWLFHKKNHISAGRPREVHTHIIPGPSSFSLSLVGTLPRPLWLKIGHTLWTMLLRNNSVLSDYPYSSLIAIVVMVPLESQSCGYYHFSCSLLSLFFVV